MTSREDFLKKIRATFKIEASEGIAKIISSLLELEKDLPDPRKAELIEAIFREAHSLKGASRAVNFSEIETLCQAMESVFSALKNKTLAFDRGMFDLFHHAVNILNDLLSGFGEEISEMPGKQVSELVVNLARAESGKMNEVRITKPVVKEFADRIISPGSGASEHMAQDKLVQPEVKAAAAISDTTIRVSVDKLDNLLFQAEEMLALNQTFDHVNEGLRSAVRKLNSWSRKSSDIFPRSLVKTIEDEMDDLRKFTTQESYNSGAKIASLLDEVKKIISVPFSTILDVFPKAARDLSKDKGKGVNVVVKGGELEIDRRILEEIRNPMMHLLRNSIDHGIEKPQIRIEKNKPEKGTIKVTVERMENSRVEITISDDGAGVDLEKLKQKYIKQQKIPAAESAAIPEQLLLDYMFRSGISTSELITDLSGRGLGLAIVQEKIEQMGGSVSVRTEKNNGTKFKIQIPLSIVTFRGVHIKVGDQEFVAPTSKIGKVLRLDKSAVKTIENKATIPYGEGIIPLVYLSDILRIPFKESEGNSILIFILGSQDNQIGFAVDGILDEEVVLVKKINSQLKRVRNISGVTVVGSGKVIPILNVSDLLKSAVKEIAHHIGEEISLKAKEKNSILVVEDSITSRMLLKNILETAGYVVTTAIDGVEGFTRLKETPFNLVVSDIDMPRMNGFDMTAKIRSDKDLSEMPIVLVTSLSKREDQERGMEVGANAYIIKSSFDQSNLLDVIERLI